MSGFLVILFSRNATREGYKCNEFGVLSSFSSPALAAVRVGGLEYSNRLLLNSDLI